MKRYLQTIKFDCSLLAFLLMMIPPIGMHFAAQGNATGWIWALLGVVVMGNLVAVIVK